MDKEIILSIYIATYNRVSIIKKKIVDILTLKSNDFNIWVLDDCSDDGTYEELKKIDDFRLNVIRNTERKGCLKDGAMTNWYYLLEKCDGQFALHLNDRDILHIDKLLDFIEFLKEHRDYVGGICDSYSGVKLYKTPEEALQAIPYRAVHPTGIVCRTDLYRTISERKCYFTKERAYIHPHDLILGELCKFGKMFEYDKLYNLADTDSFANNKSFLYKKGTNETSWFSPEERTKEFELFVKHLAMLEFDDEIKSKKAIRIAKSYVYFCTFNYKYFVTDLGQIQHYGIDAKKIGYKEMAREKNLFLEKSIAILMKYNLLDNAKAYCKIINRYYWIIFLGKPFWEVYKRGIRRKW